MPPRRLASSAPGRALQKVFNAFIAGLKRADKSLDPRDTFDRLKRHKFTFSDAVYVFHAALAAIWVYLWPIAWPLKLVFPFLCAAILLVPLTSQFFFPAIPILSWVMAFFSSRFIPVAYRPPISVSLLPTLESVLYGANISDILTRYTHPVLDIIAWLPYGVLHFTLPFVVSAFIWLFRPKEALHFWATAFGYMNLIGVLIQIALPCAPPWYELIYGLTPATYAVRGSAGGLMRIDHLLGGSGYQTTFAGAPVVFGAFPSLHAGMATIEALTWSHFFPWLRPYAWAYAAVLYWATMYLTHHYLIDVVCGACLATACFYLWLPDELCGPNALAGPGSLAARQRSKHELYGLEAPRRGTHRRGMSGRALSINVDTDMESDLSSPRDSEEEDITYRSPNPAVTPTSAVPLMGSVPKTKKSHKHTASIASLVRADNRGEEGWSPIAGRGFAFPPTPSKLESGNAP